ncbi:MAG: hypothetical protein ABSF95_07785 [Verrucomicrobiota bacterium]
MPQAVFDRNFRLKAVFIDFMVRPFDGWAWLIPLLVVLWLSGIQVPAALDQSGDSRAVQKHALAPDEKPVEKRSGPAQILIEAQLIEVQLNCGRTLGLNFANKQAPRPGCHASDGLFRRVDMLSVAEFVPTLVTNTATRNVRGFRFLSKLSGDLGPLLQALASDGRFRVLQRRLPSQTSNPERALLFFAWLPNLYGGGVRYCAGGSGVRGMQTCTLEVTPSIQADGLLVMDIRQEIGTLGTVNIPNIGEVPVMTSSDQSRGNVVVRHDEIVVLGGFVEAVRQPRFTKVPILKYIPQLGKAMLHLTAHRVRLELLVLLRQSILPQGRPVPELSGIRPK